MAKLKKTSNSVGKMWLLAALLFIWGSTASYAHAGQQIEVKTHHVLIKEVEENILEVREIMLFENQGETQVATIPLSQNHINFTVDDEIKNDVHMVEGQQGITMEVSIPAGEYKLDFIYGLEAISGAKYLLDKQILYPTGELYFLMPDQLQLMGDRVVYVGDSPMGNINFSYYYWEHPEPGQQFSLVVNKGQSTSGGEPAPSNLERGYDGKTAFHSPGHIRFWNKSPLGGLEPHLFLAVLVVGMASGAIIYFKKRSGPGSDANSAVNYPDKELEKLLTKEKVLLAKIAEANRQLQQEELDQETHDQVVKVYKQKLTEVKIDIKLLDKNQQ